MQVAKRACRPRVPYDQAHEEPANAMVEGHFANLSVVAENVTE